MKHNISRLLQTYDRMTPFVVPVIYLIAMALVISKLNISEYLKIASAIPLSAFGILTLPGFGDHLHTRIRMTILAVGLCGVAAVLCYRLNNLWIDHHGFNGAVWSIFARVIDRHGFLNTQGYCYWSGGTQFVPSATIYDHHPPGLVWMLARAGMSLNAVSSPEATVAVINTAGDPAPILAYYLDRHYQIYSRLDLATAVPGWDYYCFLHEFRGLSDADRRFLTEHLTVVADTYVPIFTSKQ